MEWWIVEIIATMASVVEIWLWEYCHIWAVWVSAAEKGYGFQAV